MRKLTAEALSGRVSDQAAFEAKMYAKNYRGGDYNSPPERGTARFRNFLDRTPVIDGQYQKLP